MPDSSVHPELAPNPLRRERARWTRVLGLAVAAFFVWMLLFAPTLQHNAQVSPVGARRTVALDLLGPFAATSRALQLSHIVSETDALTGRTGNRPGNGLAITVLGVLGPHPHRTHHHQASPLLGPPNTSTSSTVPAFLHPSAAHPLRVLIVGDSLGIDLGQPLQNDLANTGAVTATLDARESTGLTRPDYFNWPAQLASDLQKAQPQVVVVMMGANDPQDFPGPPDIPYTSAQWSTLYAQRAAQFMQVAASNGALVVWVGMPPMDNPALSTKMAAINAIDQQQAAAQKPPISFLSCWTVLGTAQGGYTAFITNAAGQVVNVRTPDGTHLTPAGGEVLSQQVLDFVRNNLHVAIP
jgi:hypothetical protein